MAVEALSELSRSRSLCRSFTNKRGCAHLRHRSLGCILNMVESYDKFWQSGPPKGQI